MNEEINCITNKKATNNELVNWDSDFLQALYSIYKKLGQFFSYIVINLFKERFISSVKKYKYFELVNKLRIKTMVLSLSKILCICTQFFNTVIKF